MAAPYYPSQPGRGECAHACADKVTYVWSHNPSAFVGLVLCALLLAVWIQQVPLSPLKGEEEEEYDG